MTIKHWQSVYNTLKVIDKPGLTILPKPSDESLDALEAASGFKLPQSYRQFIKVFGPGELIWEFRVYAPGFPDQAHADLLAFDTEVKKGFTESFLQTLTGSARVRRMIFFSRSSMGDLFGWDPEDVQDSMRHEYGVYKLGRKNHAEQVATSFQEFMESVCLTQANLNPRKWNAAELGPRNIFDPAVELPQAPITSPSKEMDSAKSAKKSKK